MFLLHLSLIIFYRGIYFLSLKLSLLCRTIDRSVFKPVVQISVVDRSESSDCHLLAVTHAGKDYGTQAKMSVKTVRCV